MQRSAGPSPRPHTRTTPAHWAGTAAALAAVVGVLALLQPPSATATAPAAPGTLSGPDATAARYPVTCPGERGRAVRPDVLASGSADFDGDGRTETVAHVRCPAGMGTPPSGIFVLAAPERPGGPPRVVETLVSPREGMGAIGFTVGERSVTARLLGYSSKDVPRCCPDQERRVRWDWSEDRFVLRAAPLTRGA